MQATHSISMCSRTCAYACVCVVDNQMCFLIETDLGGNSSHPLMLREPEKIAQKREGTLQPTRNSNRNWGKRRLKRGRNNISWETIPHSAGNKPPRGQPPMQSWPNCVPIWKPNFGSTTCETLRFWLERHQYGTAVFFPKRKTKPTNKKSMPPKGERKSLFTYLPFFLISDTLLDSCHVQMKTVILIQ